MATALSLGESVAKLGAKAGFEGPFAVSPLRGGNNNQIYRVETPRHVVALKVYFSHRGDARERLKQEFDFLRYLWASGIRSVPEPYAADHHNNLALYEFVGGDTVTARGVTVHDVEAAIGFYREINAAKTSPAAERLAPASEAAFSIREHLAAVDNRIARFEQIDCASEADAEANRFVSSELVVLWGEIRRRVQQTAERHGRLAGSLSPSLRCLSPSDFGFHNAMVQQSGTIKFIDFEYAGWDDPAKLVCDFANQPDNLLPAHFTERFRRAIVAGSAEPEHLCDRIAWLTPVYQIKWTCIVLNIFLRLGMDRHRFVTGEHETIRRKHAQLTKARLMLDRARTSYTELRGVIHR